MTFGLPIELAGDGFGIFIDWLGAKKALANRRTFARQLQSLYDLFYEHVRIHQLAVGASAITFGDTLYIEAMRDAPDLQDPIAWTKHLANEVESAGFPSVAYVTTGEIWNRIVGRGELKAAQGYGSTILDGAKEWGVVAHDEVTGVSIPLQLATIANAAGATGRWGPGVFVQADVFAALGKPAAGQVFIANGMNFHRV